MKNTYLIYKDPKAEKKELIVATPKQWDEIMKANRGATQEERRSFTCDCFEDCGELDRMYIEVEKPEFDKWHSQNVMRERNRKLGEQYAFVSTSQEIPGTDLVYEDIIADSSCNVEEEAEGKSEMAALRERLTSWKSYGVVFLDLYLKGQKGNATAIISEKYGVTMTIPYYLSLTKEDIDDFHEHGVLVYPWTVDEPDEMKRMIDMGADGMLTNRMDLLQSFR